MVRLPIIPPSLAWTFVFLPAVLYLLVTRLPSSSRNRLFYGMEYGVPVTTTVTLFPADPHHHNNNNDDTNSIRNLLRKVFPYGSTTTASTNHFELRYPLQLIYEIPIKSLSLSSTTTTTKISPSSLSVIQDIIYRYDSNMGRGYMLYTVHNENRIYRYEIGNGLFPIGNTLFMDQACCRSHDDCHNRNHPYKRWCGPLALEYDFDTATTTTTSTTTTPTTTSTSVHKTDSKLIIAEYGERRIVRLEEEHGARTPLIMHMPLPADHNNNNNNNNNHNHSNDNNDPQQYCNDVNNNNNNNSSNIGQCTPQSPSTQRLSNPDRMVYTPQGDLLVVVNQPYHHPTTSTKETDNSINEAVVTNNTEDGPMIILVPNTLHTAPLLNLQQSRAAHYWVSLEEHQPQQQHHVPYIFYQHANILWIGDIAFSSDGRTLYGMAEIMSSTTPSSPPTSTTTSSNNSDTIRNTSMVIFQLSIHSEVDDDDDDDDYDPSSQPHKERKEMTILLDLTQYFYDDKNVDDNVMHQQQQRSASLIVGQRSGLLYITAPNGILLVDPTTRHLIGQLTIPSTLSPSSLLMDDTTKTKSSSSDTESLSYPTALTLSGDGYLYIAANRNKLYRIRTNDGPVVFLPKKNSKFIKMTYK
jgi:hypothetical protein